MGCESLGGSGVKVMKVEQERKGEERRKEEEGLEEAMPKAVEHYCAACVYQRPYIYID